MRIAYLVPAPGVPVQGPNGCSAHVRGVVGALSLDHDVRLYAARRVDRRGAFGSPLPAEETGLPSWPGVLRSWQELREVRAARRLAARVEADAHDGWMPDLIIERHSLFSDAGWRLHDRLGLPWVLEVNAPALMERRRFEQLHRPDLGARWERRVLQAAPVVVGVSQWLVRWLKEEVGCRNALWVPNGVPALRGDRARGRAALGLSESDRAVGFVGSMRPWHGVERLPAIAAAAQARLVLIGPTTPDQVPAGALATGFLDGQALADAVAALDVGLSPHPADAPPWFCPLKILDYRAQGTPVVATDVGDAAALVEDGGSVVPADDRDALVTAVLAWMGRRSTPRVRSWRSVARELLAASGRGASPARFAR